MTDASGDMDKFIEIIRAGGRMVVAPDVVRILTEAGVDPLLYQVSNFVPPGYMAAWNPPEPLAEKALLDSFLKFVV